MSATLPGPDGQPRCRWCAADAAYTAYHDQEWGFPVADDRRLFEKICLEGFQSGLSWRTILNKRQHFRAAFDGFDFHRVARYGQADVQRLLADAGIVRHRGKIEATVNNAARAVDLAAECGSLATYLWRWEEAATVPGADGQIAVRATSPQSEALSKDLKRRGWRFVGPTTVYAFMQAMGLVNDHAADCVLRAAVQRARAGFHKP